MRQTEMNDRIIKLHDDVCDLMETIEEVAESKIYELSPLFQAASNFTIELIGRKNTILDQCETPFDPKENNS